MVISVVVPLQGLVLQERTWLELGSAIRAGKGAILNSLLLSAASATVVVAVGLGSWRWRGGFWFWLPFLVPGILLGVLLIVALNRPPFLAFYRGMGVVVLAFVIRYGVVGWAGARHAMRSVEKDLVDAGRADGASRWELMWQVLWPQLAPRLGATWLIVYLLCLWDVETLLLISPPGAETVAGRVFGLLHYGHNAQVSALCLVLLALAIWPLLGGQGVRWLRRCWGGGSGNPFGHATGMVPIMVLCLTGCRGGSGDGTIPESRLFERVEVIGSKGRVGTVSRCHLPSRGTTSGAPDLPTVARTPTPANRTERARLRVVTIVRGRCARHGNGSRGGDQQQRLHIPTTK